MFSMREREELRVQLAVFYDMLAILLQQPETPVHLLNNLQSIIDDIEDVLYPEVVEGDVPANSTSEAV